MNIFRGMSPQDEENRSNKMLFGIICVTVLGFIITLIPRSPLPSMLCMHAPAVKDLEIWRLFSSMLVNPSGWDLFFEMFAFYIFGTILTPRMGSSKILSLYLFGGLAGNLLWLAVCWNSDGWVYGCTGAVNGVIMASAMMFPNLQMFLLFIPFPIKLRTMAIVFIILNILFAGLTSFSLIGLGGFIGGYLFMRFFLRNEIEWDPLDSLLSRKKEKTRHTVYEFKSRPDVTQAGKSMPDRNEVDRILDKLSRTGINSLTPDEIAVLERVREIMNRKNG